MFLKFQAINGGVLLANRALIRSISADKNGCLVTFSDGDGYVIADKFEDVEAMIDALEDD